MTEKKGQIQAYSALPLWMRWVGGLAIVANSVYVGYYGLSAYISVLTSLYSSAGIIVTFLFAGIGGICCFAGVMFGLGSLDWVGDLQGVRKYFEFIGKTTGLFMLSIVGTWTIYFIGMYLLSLILAVFGHKIEFS